MKLNVLSWKEFIIGDYFDVLLSAGDLKIDDCEVGNVPLVSSGSTKNGIVGYIDEKGDGKAQIFKGNCITVDMFCNAFYQNQDFYAVSHGRVNILYPKFKCNLQIGLFICSIIKKEQFKYSYGRAVYSSEISNMLIKLPATTDGLPDWEFMESYIKSIHHKKITTDNATNEMSNIKTDDWQEFRFGNLISKIYKAKALNKEDLLISDERSNSIRYITRTSEDNGCEFRAILNEINPSFIEKGNAISIGDTTATCFYQSEKFITGDHMVVVRADWLNKTNALFIVAILNKEQYKYSYGRAFLMDRIKDTIIKLPVKKNADGTEIIDGTHKYSEDGYIPDWEFMENYIKRLPYGDRI